MGPIGPILFDGFSDGGMTVNLAADEIFQIHLTPVVKLRANPRELVRSGLGHLQREQLHFATIDHHASSSGLYLSCDRTHSSTSTSSRGPW